MQFLLYLFPFESSKIQRRREIIPRNCNLLKLPFKKNHSYNFDESVETCNSSRFHSLSILFSSIYLHIYDHINLSKLTRGKLTRHLYETES